jgi:L-aspartate oxidase
MKTDVLIIGSGIAGLTLAIKVARSSPDRRVVIVTKKGLLESNTNLAQGGIAVALNGHDDSFEKHIEDTLRAGDGLCERAVVEKVVRDAPQRLQELADWGIEFDKDENGKVQLGREGGHSENRIVHHKDVTGNFVAERLVRQVQRLKNIRVLTDHFAIDLVTRRERLSGKTACTGAVVFDVTGKRRRSIVSRVTVLATGGAGQVYASTTNPLVATGDGVAMAFRAGARVSDMEFIQFHPTAFYSEDENPCFLISEAVRGFGGYLRGKNGERFVLKHDNRGELASRDIVSKAIHQEMLHDGVKSVYLDCRHLEQAQFRKHFPNIYDHCLSKGLDVAEELIPVAPAAHYICGGVDTDISGLTSLKNLYACGECARTGLHGANRLASNSLLEALVFAHQIFLSVDSSIDAIRMPSEYVIYRLPNRAAPRDEWVASVRKSVRAMMSNAAGIVRSTSALLDASRKLRIIGAQLNELYSVSQHQVDIGELRNIVQVSQLIVDQSLARTENKGTFFNMDLNKQ